MLLPVTRQNNTITPTEVAWQGFSTSETPSNMADVTTRDMTFNDDILVTTAKFIAKSSCFTTFFGGSMTL